MLIPMMIIQAVFFTGMVLVLRFFYMRQLNAALARLNALHEQNLIKEAQLTEELKRASEERKAEVEKGKEEAAALVEDAKKDIAQMRLKAETEAKAQAEKIIHHGKDEAERLREKMIKDVQSQSLDLAVKMIEETFTEENKEDLQRQFITEIIEEIAKVPKDKFSVSAEQIKVVSSHILDESHKISLKKVLDGKLNTAVNLEVTINKGLISGLVLEIGGLVIDGSLKNRLRQAVSSLKE